MARKEHHEEHQNHEAWAIPYGDLITLLLAFFVVMYAVSSVNEGKYRVLSDSLNAAFRGQPRTLDPIAVGDKVVHVKRDDTSAGLTPTQAMKLPGKAALAKTSIAENFAKLGRRIGEKGLAAGEAGQPMRKLAKEIEQAMAPLIDRNLVSVTRQPLWVEVQIKADVIFPSGKAEIQAPAMEVLQHIAAILKPLPSPIRVEGHTDNRPISTALFPSNWELSGARASRIVRLFQNLGIAPDRMSVAGLADQQPLADNSTDEGRNRNRRVTLIILDTAAAESAENSAAASSGPSGSNPVAQAPPKEEKP